MNDHDDAPVELSLRGLTGKLHLNTGDDDDPHLQLTDPNTGATVRISLGIARNPEALRELAEGAKLLEGAGRRIGAEVRRIIRRRTEN